jgi:hypothetical protein
MIKEQLFNQAANYIQVGIAEEEEEYTGSCTWKIARFF